MNILEHYDTPIHREQVRALFQQSPFLFFGIIFVMVVVAAFFWERAERDVLLIWLAANVALTLARVVLVKSFQRQQPQGHNMQRWGLTFALSSTVSGMLWGSIAILFLQTSETETVLLVAIVLTGMAAGSLVPLSAFIPAYYGFTLCALSPLAYVLLINESDVLVFIGSLVLAFIVVNLGYSFVVNRNLAESIRLRFENLDLLESLRQQKELAEKANADKSRFLAATSHDLRQPLHALDLYLGALANLIDADEQQQLLHKSRQASTALNSLLTALMDISRLDAGDVVVERKPTNIKSLLDAIADEFRDQAQQLGIEIDVDAPAVFADTDPLMLSRMLRNLLNNACAHSGANRITLRAQTNKNTVCVSVCDDGAGIPTDQQQHVFSEFYQLNNPERDREKGLGLGLAIVKRLADLLQHALKLESAPEKGCCFHLELPLVDGVQETVVSEVETADGDISGSFIVLVDDEVGVRDAMRTLLRQWGCELLLTDSVQALQDELLALDYPRPDIIIADYRLRDNTTGIDAVQVVHDRFDSAIPAVIISGDTDRSVQRQTDKHGCLLLHKPVQPAVLRDVLTRIMRV